MTENEAKVFIKNAKEHSKNVLAELFIIAPKVFAVKKESLGEYYSNLENCKKEIEACEVAVQALEEIQPYRAIGTVEECMEAVAKQAAKKVCGIHKSEAPDDIETYGEETLFGYCPVCGELQNTLWNSFNCGDCGQKLDWSDGE